MSDPEIAQLRREIEELTRAREAAEAREKQERREKEQERSEKEQERYKREAAEAREEQERRETGWLSQVKALFERFVPVADADPLDDTFFDQV
ncbi:uncharacterized protein PG986_014373 [Apiospora aurea]|uniref:Uncharacterized protein n=1 Tax=Apiospora aurea TaxID=335848 RepID=A0ABR1PST2_9PEZI